MITWRFPSNNYGETKGINDSGVAMFRGTPLKSLAREICQNSLDAAQNTAVVVDFDLFYIPTCNIPGIEKLKDAFARSFNFWQSSKGGSTREFFENATKIVNKTNCAMLRISDHNTTGLLGSREIINTDWVNLTKAAGASDKLGTAGGSFGIGKYAPFACSDFSTVFYSTCDMKGEMAYQGVSRLVTFEDANGETTQGVGYYGEERNTPVYEQLFLQDSYKRANADFGTDIYIAGYKYDNGEWQTNIITSVLDSFLGAIWNEKLIVNVGKVELSKKTMPSVIEEYKNNLIGSTADYYEVLTSDTTKWKIYDFPGLGEVKYGVMLGNPNSSRKVAMIRKTGMKIKDKGNLSSSVPFAGVLFIQGDKLNQRLRAMENPEHTEWQPERIVSNPTAGKAVLSHLYKFLRDTIQEFAYEGESQEIDAAGAGTFLPDEDPNSEHQVKEEVISNKIQDVEKKVKPAPESKAQPEEMEEEQIWDDAPDGDETGTSRATNGEQIGWVDGENGHMTNNGNGTQLTYSKITAIGNDAINKSPVRNSIFLQKFVPICINKEKGLYVLVVSAVEDYPNCEMELFLSAESGSYAAPVISAEIPGGAKIRTKGNVLENISLSKEKAVRIKLVLDYSELCSMEVKAYAIKK